MPQERKVFVGGVPQEITEEDLYANFSRYSLGVPVARRRRVPLWQATPARAANPEQRNGEPRAEKWRTRANRFANSGELVREPEFVGLYTLILPRVRRPGPNPLPHRRRATGTPKLFPSVALASLPPMPNETARVGGHVLSKACRPS